MLQSLVFWAGVPVVWMLVTLLIIIMYFCYRCCQREVEKSTPCIKWAIGILALLSWQVTQFVRLLWDSQYVPSRILEPSIRRCQFLWKETSKISYTLACGCHMHVRFGKCTPRPKTIFGALNFEMSLILQRFPLYPRFSCVKSFCSRPD